MRIYLNLRGKKWIMVEDVLEQVVTSKGRKVLRYILVGLSVDNPPLDPSRSINEDNSLLVPANIVNKLIMKLLGKRIKELDVIFDYYDREHYLLKIPRGDPWIVLEILDEFKERDQQSK